MTDRIMLADLKFQARHGVHDWERETDQPFEVDVELVLDLRPAGESDDLARTMDYGRVYATVAEIVTGRSYALIEALAEAIATASGSTKSPCAFGSRVCSSAVRSPMPVSKSADDRRTEAVSVGDR